MLQTARGNGKKIACWWVPLRFGYSHQNNHTPHASSNTNIFPSKIVVSFMAMYLNEQCRTMAYNAILIEDDSIFISI